jgi:hypothetical protein
MEQDFGEPCCFRAGTDEQGYFQVEGNSGVSSPFLDSFLVADYLPHLG